MISPKNITELLSTEVFVFGSNLAGYHGIGAAKNALKFGARWNIGYGPEGQTYAIPTKLTTKISLPLEKIEIYVKEFLQYAAERQNTTFLVTEIGCGYAGYTPEQIGPFFANSTDNVALPASFNKYKNQELDI